MLSALSLSSSASSSLVSLSFSDIQIKFCIRNNPKKIVGIWIYIHIHTYTIVYSSVKYSIQIQTANGDSTNAIPPPTTSPTSPKIKRNHRIKKSIYLRQQQTDRQTKYRLQKKEEVDSMRSECWINDLKKCHNNGSKWETSKKVFLGTVFIGLIEWKNLLTVCES